MTALSLHDRIRACIRQDVSSMHAYAVQPSAGLLKLDAMENPYPLPPELQRALGERLSRLPLHRYPTASSAALAQTLADFVQLPSGCRLMLGNGSDELIDLLSVACNVPGATIMAPVPGFVMYEMSARLRRLSFVGVPLTPDFELDLPAMLDAVATHRPALTFLACPNNPTANLWDEAAVQAVIDAVGECGGLVVVDEAYQPFASRTFLPRLPAHPHVLVMRTLSKFGLAGVRVGYLCGHAALVEEVDKVRPPYNISVLNAEAAMFALEHADAYAQQAQAIVRERERLLQSLPGLPGVRAFPSDANMILVRVPDARGVFESLRRQGVLVKHVAPLHALLENCLRLTVGTPDENERLLAALAAALQPV
jgi:histidinol-phosphate aminotransferase